MWAGVSWLGGRTQNKCVSTLWSNGPLWQTTTLDNIISVSWEIFAACHETFFWVTYPDQIKRPLVSLLLFFPFFLSMLENELRHSACSNWKMYSPCRRCFLLVCLCVGLCLCMPVCRQWGTDAERCVLIFCNALGSSGSHVGLLWCHACVTSEYSAQKLLRGMIKMAHLAFPCLSTLSASVSLSFYQSFLFSHNAVCALWAQSFLSLHTHTDISWGVKKQPLSHLKVQHFYQSTTPFWPLYSFNCTCPYFNDTFVLAFICHYV